MFTFRWNILSSYGEWILRDKYGRKDFKAGMTSINCIRTDKELNWGIRNIERKERFEKYLRGNVSWTW